jgi:hypothetical protein
MDSPDKRVICLVAEVGIQNHNLVLGAQRLAAVMANRLHISLVTSIHFTTHCTFPRHGCTSPIRF